MPLFSALDDFADDREVDLDLADLPEVVDFDAPFFRVVRRLDGAVSLAVAVFADPFGAF